MKENRHSVNNMIEKSVPLNALIHIIFCYSSYYILFYYILYYILLLYSVILNYV